MVHIGRYGRRKERDLFDPGAATDCAGGEHGDERGARYRAMLELAFAADEIIDLHLHGYDRHLTVHPGEEAVMRLDAKLAGRFPIEAHRFGGPAGASPSRGHVVLLYLEIYPR